MRARAVDVLLGRDPLARLGEREALRERGQADDPVHRRVGRKRVEPREHAGAVVAPAPREARSPLPRRPSRSSRDTRPWPGSSVATTAASTGVGPAAASAAARSRISAASARPSSSVIDADRSRTVAHDRVGAREVAFDPPSRVRELRPQRRIRDRRAVRVDVQERRLERRPRRPGSRGAVRDHVDVRDRHDPLGEVEHLGGRRRRPPRDVRGDRERRLDLLRPRARFCLALLRQPVGGDHRRVRRGVLGGEARSPRARSSAARSRAAAIVGVVLGVGGLPDRQVAEHLDERRARSPPRAPPRRRRRAPGPPRRDP